MEKVLYGSMVKETLQCIGGYRVSKKPLLCRVVSSKRSPSSDVLETGMSSSRGKKDQPMSAENVTAADNDQRC